MRRKEPANLTRGLVQGKQACAEARVVLEEGIHARLRILERAVKPELSRWIAFVPCGCHRVEDELGGVSRCVQIAGVFKDCAGLGEGPDHQAIPCHDDLVVAGRFHAGFSSLIEGFANTSDCAVKLGDGDPEFLRNDFPITSGMQNILVFEVSTIRDIEPGTDDACIFFADDLCNFRRRPHEELALDTLGVGVLSGVEPPVWGGHFPEDVIKDFAADISVEGVPCCLP